MELYRRSLEINFNLINELSCVYLSIAGSMESLAQRAIFHCGGLEEGVTFILYFWWFFYNTMTQLINSYKLSIIFN